MDARCQTLQESAGSRRTDLRKSPAPRCRPSLRIGASGVHCPPQLRGRRPDPGDPSTRRRGATTTDFGTASVGLQEHLDDASGLFLHNPQQRLGRSGRVTACLPPLLKRLHTWHEQSDELRLREIGLPIIGIRLCGRSRASGRAPLRWAQAATAVFA